MCVILVQTHSSYKHSWTWLREETNTLVASMLMLFDLKPFPPPLAAACNLRPVCIEILDNDLVSPVE